jgi:trans-aconitate methyltransferase
MAGEGGATHWDEAYASGETTRSWYQSEPALSLQMFAAAGVSDQNSVIDVGGGASTLVDALLSRGFRDVTVLDISTAGLQAAQRRLGSAAEDVDWLTADVLSWRPPRRYQTWHDRAVYHFLTTNQDQQLYLRTLHAATGPGARAVFGCFAPDGPQHCSGLPVARYDRQQLGANLGSGWIAVSDAREEHVTPAGVIQPFTWAAFRRQP